MPVSDLPLLVYRLRRHILRHRRLIAATFAAVALVAMMRVVMPAEPVTTSVVVAAHDLSGGSQIKPADVRTVRLDPAVVPAGSADSVEAVLGETVAGPMRSGEPVTDRRLVGPALIKAYGNDLVATPVRIRDADAVALVQTGDQIDVYAATGEAGTAAAAVVIDAPVVLVPPPDERGSDGALLVLALTSSDAARLAQAEATTALSISVRG